MLDPATLEQQIKAAFDAESDVEVDPAQARARTAQAIAAAIDAFVRGAQVNPGIPVSTAGTAAAQTGATTAPGTIS